MDDGGSCLEGGGRLFQDEERLSGGCAEAIWRVKQCCLQVVGRLSEEWVDGV